VIINAALVRGEYAAQQFLYLYSSPFNVVI
jgi:hypothetical protein